MPIKLVEGTFAQLGKKMVYQGHGYWVHGLLSNVTQYNPFSLKNNLSRMDVSSAASLLLLIILLFVDAFSVVSFVCGVWSSRSGSEVMLALTFLFSFSSKRINGCS